MEQMRKPPQHQRAYGEIEIEMTKMGLSKLYQRGSSKVLRPRRQSEQAVMINTAGGLTSGDAFSVMARLAPEAKLTLSTQSAERVYACPDRPANVQNHAQVQAGARFYWLPLETILYNQAKLNRRLQISLEGDAECLAVETIIFGRHAMNEEIEDIAITDRLEIRRDDVPLFFENFATQNADDLLHPFGLRRAQAMSIAVLASPNAPDKLEAARRVIQGGAVSAMDGILIARLLNDDAWQNRQNLTRLLEVLTEGETPFTWKL